MLAVVFWHARNDSTTQGAYDAALRAFHGALNAHKPQGFRFSTSHRVATLPWFAARHEVHEDWYVLSNFAAMDALDHAVIHDQARQAHTTLVASVAAASGAIVGLADGPARTTHLAEAYWLAAGRNDAARSLLDDVRRQCPDGRFSLWTRAMGLGPAAHCLLSSQALDPADDWQVTHIHREPVWQPLLPSDRQRTAGENSS